MKKTTIQLTDEQYFYLKEKALALQKKNQSTSLVSLIRQLIDEDMKHSRRKPPRGVAEKNRNDREGSAI
jgi:hypothetical protein